MKGVDLHPEELLERDARGALSPDERQRLQTHLDRCDVCRFERLAQADFRLEVDQAEDVDVRRLLAAALTPESLRVPVPARRTPRRWSRAALIAAALVTLAGVSTASGWSVLRVTFSQRERAEETPVEGPSTARPPVVSPRAAPVSTALTLAPLALPEPESPAPTAGPEASQSPVTAPAPPPAPAPTFAARRPPAEPSSIEVPGPASLFTDATRARRSGDRDAAGRAYRMLIASYPASSEGRQALAALGQMLLDGGDPGGALRCFDEYLRGGGLLREDVMVDRATALARLGRPADEIEAWSALIGAFPASVHGERARRRLAELEAR